MIWRFTARIKDLPEFSDELTDALHERCPDSSLSSSNGRSKIGFDREAPLLEVAIRSALNDILAVGLVVESVELDVEDLAELPQ
jgi:hypothetical protein